MWTRAQIAEDLSTLGLLPGSDVLAHASMKAIGEVDGGAAEVVEAFLEVLGEDGTLMVPTFHRTYADPADRRYPPETESELVQLRAEVPPYDPQKPASSPLLMGVFSEAVRKHPKAFRSQHPGLSFAAIGAQAERFTERVPFDYPLGTHSPLNRLYDRNGQVLLIGTHHSVNTSIHLAEVWANVAYIHRSAHYKLETGEWGTMAGSPECSRGFGKIESLLRQSRILKEGYIGNAPSQRMSQRQVISMAMAMLEGKGSALLCIDEDCRWCTLARRMTATPDVSYAPIM